jgi:SNF2 family DNA or RNA helicase
MSEEQNKVYLANLVKIKEELNQNAKELTEGQNRMKVLAALTRMRQICCDPVLVYENYKDESAKTEACLELIKSSTEASHRILLFSQFTSMLDILESRLNNEGIKYLRLDGSVSSQKRLGLVSDFNNGDEQVFLISLKAGGTGLNLTGADVVIHYDPWWNVSAQNQATDRAYRIGQTRNVMVYKLIVKGTIEEKIIDMQNRKADIANSVIKQGGDEFSSLSKDDLIGLFED